MVGAEQVDLSRQAHSALSEHTEAAGHAASQQRSTGCSRNSESLPFFSTFEFWRRSWTAALPVSVRVRRSSRRCHPLATVPARGVPAPTPNLPTIVLTPCTTEYESNTAEHDWNATEYDSNTAEHD